MNVPEGYRELPGSRRTARAGARRIGDADPAEPAAVTITLRRRPGAPPLPDPAAGGSGGEPLSREEFARRYGAADEDLRRVEQFAAAYGLSVVESSAARRSVRVSGTVARLNSAFAVDLGRYESATETYRGREGAVHIPADLAGMIEGVFGLDNRRMARPALTMAAGTAQGQTGTPANSVALTPPQVAQLYEFPSGPATGQTIGLLEFGGGYQLSDIQAYYRTLGLATPPITDIGVDGQTNSFGGGTDEDVEVALDIDVAGSVAPGVRIAVYFSVFSQDGWVDAVSTAVHDSTNHPSVLSISWGWAESEGDWSKAAMSAVSTQLQEAAAVGVTIFAASGDDGSNCQIYDGKAHVLYPAADPNVTAVGGTTVSGGWEHNDLTDLANAPAAVSGSALDSYSTEFNEQQHVNYLASDGDRQMHVHELWFSNEGGWQHNDLTAAANAPAAAPGSPLDGYATEFNQQQHVNYIGTDGNVHELWYSNEGGWQHSPLGALTHAPAAAGSLLDGYATGFNEQQHVNYFDGSGHVHELWYSNGVGWGPSDLTSAAGGAPPAFAGSAIDGYATGFNEQQHVNYFDGAGHVHELWYMNGVGWRPSDLTAAAGAPTAVAGSAIDGYATEFNEQQHINYLDGTGHVHELWYSNGVGWRHNPLTQTAGAPTAVPGSAIDGYATEFNEQQHVNYFDSVGHVHELWYSNGVGWGHNLLNSPPAAQGSPLHGYQTAFNEQQHVNYLDANGHVHELWYGNGNTPQTSFVENTWNDNGATGGGVSEVFPLPTWQQGAGVPPSVNDGYLGRGVPDVAGNADQVSGYVLVVNGAGTEPVGGTSAAAPLYAGLVALLNTHLRRSVGYLNPQLYALPREVVFRDVADGRDNSTGGATGYPAAAGWDGCTGLGSINGTALLEALS
jgi:Pro-kumamolisin, activation domain